ncbi:DHA2 family efflux MFS transporter permease subunit [Stakelama marina]|uniref:DHA2 family efflux MFS transporter permease subunit n=1 Tax=Stakelama marina TaxID=2826939 RepID=A0A8T4IES7_9SPHN|nr:DHA2 family efflux MFS transporter permease subunit [Stakelama marina]MBR0553063.1 DHA2 family efflux MFS transporter permease subunit [Stakelama marina]
MSLDARTEPEPAATESGALSEAAMAPPETGFDTDTHRGPLLPMIIGTALFMQTLDSTIIANALPQMARALGESAVTLNLAITSYLLAAAIFLPISAWVADRFGPKRVFRTAIIGFALSSLLCGLAQNLPMLIAARMLQGMAGAMMLPVGRLVLLRSVPKSELVQAMTWLTMPALLGPILGPPVGGFIVTFFSWRWIFFINIPMGILGAILVTIFLPDVREERPGKLDWTGFALTGLGLAGIVYGFDNLGRGALPTWLVAAMLIGGVASLALFVRHERRVDNPILDLSLLRVQTYAAGTVGGMFSRLVIGASPFLLALLLQLGFGLSAFAAGSLTFAGALGALVMKVVARPIIAWFGFRPILLGNAVIVAAMSAAYALFRAGTPHWVILGVLLVGGFFRSLHFTALNAMAYADIDAPQMSRASSLATMFQQMAQSIGVGLAAVLVHQAMLWRGSTELTAADISPAFAIVALVSLIGMAFYWRLPADAGAEVSGREQAGN